MQKFQKSARETRKVCVKKVKKMSVKATFCREKNRKKGPKWLSRTLLVFTGKKNTGLKSGH